MPDAAPLADPTAPFRACPACGAWARAAACPRCGWAEPADARPPGAIPALLDIVVGASGELSLAAVWCARLPWLEADTAFCSSLAISGAMPASLRDWRDAVVAATQAAIREDLSRVLPAALSPPVTVTLRVHNQQSALDLSACDIPGLAIIAFDAAIAESGRELRSDEVIWEFGEVDLRVRAGQEGPRGTVRIARPAMVEELLLRTPEHILSRAAVRRETGPGVGLTLTLPEPSARDVRQFQEFGCPWEIGVRVSGRAEPVWRPLPQSCSRELPTAVADLFVHPGSVSFRFCLVSDAAELWQSMSMTEAIRTLGLPPFDKAALAADPDVFAAWIDDATRPLAAWAQRTRGVWLRDVVVATPGDESFAASVNRAGVEGPSTASDGVMRPCEASRVLLGTVVGRPEFLALARHVRPVLSAAAALLVAHRKKHADVLRLADARLRWWESARRQMKNPLLGMLVSDPGPAPDPAPGFEPLGIADGWLEERLEQDPGMRHLVLVDFGGSRIDVSLLRDGAPVLLLVVDAGSERVMSAPEPEWEALTVDVYGPALTALPEQLRAATDQPFVIVASGGGLANPWLRDLVDAGFLAAGFPAAPLVAAADLVRLATTACARGLDSPALTRFLAVHEQDGGIPGRFDIVDGLRSQEST